MEKAVNKKSSINIVIYFHCISTAVDNNIPVSCGGEHFVPIWRQAVCAGPGRGGLVLEQPDVHHRQVTSPLEILGEEQDSRLSEVPSSLHEMWFECRGTR